MSKKCFLQLGWVEEIGTGIYNINKYLPFYSQGRKASFVEDVIFTTTIPIPKLNGLQMRDMKKTTPHDTTHDTLHDNSLQVTNKIWGQVFISPGKPLLHLPGFYH